jgi:hypothetical protein
VAQVHGSLAGCIKLIVQKTLKSATISCGRILGRLWPHTISKRLRPSVDLPDRKNHRSGHLRPDDLRFRVKSPNWMMTPKEVECGLGAKKLHFPRIFNLLPGEAAMTGQWKLPMLTPVK